LFRYGFADHYNGAANADCKLPPAETHNALLNGNHSVGQV
jgi:hypothetical protein